MKQYTWNSVANPIWKESSHACVIGNDRVWSRDDNVNKGLRQMTNIARLDYMANENKLYVIRPRENSISNLFWYEIFVEGTPSFLCGVRLDTFLPG